MKRLLISAAIAAIALPAWGQVQADHKRICYISALDENGDGAVCDPSLIYRNSVIVTADRIGSSSTDKITSPSSILTQTEIQARNQGVIADLLRTIPGLSVSQSGGAGALTQIRLRGSEANHVTVIIDGVEVANPSDGAFDFGGLRNEDIVKIEVLRGEQSALYGSDAIGGVIKLSPERVARKKAGALALRAAAAKHLKAKSAPLFP